MSSVSTSVRSGVIACGGALGYPSQQLKEEVAAIAYHFHWSLSDILELDHLSRDRWVQAIKKHNNQARK
ncbi:DUF6760 family protein [Oscillatoria sp. CS-180]|uniref:DUF6760 family protein n=1 Tax=Oscillatoria sp. CS-180 TaxID=3021720 RepID=UPI002FEE60AB